MGTIYYNWAVPTDDDYVKDTAGYIRGTAGDIDNTLHTINRDSTPVGLQKITTQTIGSGVSSVTVTNAFSSTYDNYKIIVSGGTGSTNATLELKLGSTTSGYKFNLWYAGFGGGHTGATSSAASSFPYMGYVSANGINMNCDILMPYLTKTTLVTGYYQTPSEAGSFQGLLNNTTSYTDFTLTTSASITGGTVTVYGYRNIN